MNKNIDNITSEQVRHHFQYQPGGTLLWVRPRSVRAKVGMEAGRIDKHGYRVVDLFGKRLKQHHVVLKWFGVDIPKEYEVDHINRVRHDNRIENLRVVTHGVNAMNRASRSNTGCKNVHMKHQDGRIYFIVDVADEYVGCYSNLFDAACAAKSREYKVILDGQI